MRSVHFMKIKDLKQERLNLLLLKNTILIVIPAVIVFVFILVFTHFYPVIYQMTCHTVRSYDEIQDWYQKECFNVRMRVPQIRYTGYDYYEDGRQAGAYYYAFMEEQCMFFLIKTKDPEPEINDVMIKGKLLGNSANLDAMKNEFSKELGLDSESFQSVVHSLMISEVDYPYLENFLLWLLIIMPYGLAGCIIVLSVIWTIQPYRHPSTKALGNFGDRKLVYEEVKSQLKYRLVQHAYNYYITDDYLIISNWFKTDFIRIDYIRYISRHIITKMNGKNQVFRLTMSNPEKMFYERDFRSEACTDEIMEALVRLNPNIDNRTMKVFELSEKQEEKQEQNIEVKSEETEILKETEESEDVEISIDQGTIEE